MSPSRPRRVAVFGGSFDPVHLGHLHLARTAADRLGFDQVRLLLAPNAPHKRRPEDRPKLGVAERLALLEAAVAGDARFVVDDAEVRRAGSSYTFDTLCELEAALPDGSEIFFLIGADSLRDLPKWHRAVELAARFTLVTVPREAGETAAAALAPVAQAFPADLVERLRRHFVDVAPLPISSTDIRQRIRDGRPFRHLVPADVARLIDERGFYQGTVT